MFSQNQFRNAIMTASPRAQAHSTGRWENAMRPQTPVEWRSSQFNRRPRNSQNAAPRDRFPFGAPGAKGAAIEPHGRNATHRSPRKRETNKQKEYPIYLIASVSISPRLRAFSKYLKLCTGDAAAAIEENNTGLFAQDCLLLQTNAFILISTFRCTLLLLVLLFTVPLFILVVLFY